MKKLLGIIVLGLLLNGCETTSSLKPSPGEILISSENHIVIQRISPWKGADDPRMTNKASNHCSQYNKFAYKYMNDWDMNDGSRFVFRCKEGYAPTHLVNGEQKTVTWSNYDSASQLTKTTKDISFTIKDKKEQCTAIGFEPATEKFADCVLRLVELDVKTQQTNQIALAQSQGNQQIADQLKKQSNDQSSQYFLDLGQKLLNPQSTVSAPSTSTCTISGGVYKNITCW